MEGTQLKEGFHRVEMSQTAFIVPLRYRNLEPIGSGAFGQVCSADDTLLGIKVAIKRMTKPFMSKVHAKRTYRELRMLKHMNHDNIIGLFDAFTPAKTLEDFDEVYLVTHLMSIDLHKLLKAQASNLTSEHVEFFIYQILRGLKYVHSAGIIHRDLKTSNIAINEENELRILDFGLARQTDDEMTGYVFTRWYRSPEVILSWTRYSNTADIWSVGCIMAEMLIGKPLFPGGDHIDQLVKIMAVTGKPTQSLMQRITSEDARNYVNTLPDKPKVNFREYFGGVDPVAVDLLERMLDLDPEERISAAEALAHPYLSKYHDEEDEPVSEPFDPAFEKLDFEIDVWKERVIEEINNFKPIISTDMDTE